MNLSEAVQKEIERLFETANYWRCYPLEKSEVERLALLASQEAAREAVRICEDLTAKCHLDGGLAACTMADGIDAAIAAIASHFDIKGE